jgi:hypothetical protein|mmetsp:Transcript_66219/g.110601  ORF Transcript_66219/g.110601 Transcript_66219/m.110601 type:complete len:191 (+) Transcript_66219:581-1153(+)
MRRKSNSTRANTHIRTQRHKCLVTHADHYGHVCACACTHTGARERDTQSSEHAHTCGYGSLVRVKPEYTHAHNAATIAAAITVGSTVAPVLLAPITTNVNAAALLPQTRSPSRHITYHICGGAAVATATTTSAASATANTNELGAYTTTSAAVATAGEADCGNPAAEKSAPAIWKTAIMSSCLGAVSVTS